MRILHCIVIVLTLFITVGLYAQSSLRRDYAESQETYNALTNQRVNSISKQVTAITDDVSRQNAEIQLLRSSLDRVTGIGIGAGSILTILQAFIMILTFRNGGKKE